MRLTFHERREAVLGAAVTEFARGGLHGTAMDRIAERAGISQPYLFRLFPNKRALFEAAFVRSFRRSAELYAQAAGDLRGEAALDAMARARERLLDEGGFPQLRLHAVTAVLPAGDPGLTTCVRRCWSELRTTIEERTGAAPERVRAFLAEELLLVVERTLG
ncbi:AcrR family transcriptional regulator [Streptomyces griseochromogenes]|uniref:AcrR family transcriptional regulator n=1 Tax=Streptomyces griseochromogenes TaxID=68214 RepID=A0A1B1AP44_9ACTN|nr:TetR/AcrR family transcriptional regulator [Streptomyces griseochromogenes]ANP48295.1 hypothetical protein AVL59_00755 [Streptomyces griseochromogenes]MBP2050769.1 AcrR family transcriptional regulator [Streptomyces griseochromogenes]